MRCFHESHSTNGISENEHFPVPMATEFQTFFRIRIRMGTKMTETLTQWVEYKIGKILSEDLEKIVVSEDCDLDVDKYSSEMFERHFANAPEINHLKCEITKDKRKKFELDDIFSTDDLLQDSSDDDFRPASLDDVISDLRTPSEDSRLKALNRLEACSAEEMMAHDSWTVARKLLQDLVRVPASRKVSTKVLQLFRRFLSSKDAPKVVCEGFVTLAESVAFGIDAFNAEKSEEESKQEIFDFKTNKWVDANLFSEKRERDYDIEMIFKSTWLLLSSQKGIPYKWIRFNEKRLREIVFSFIHMISSTTNFKGGDRLCGLEILAVLDPRAMWCVNWCHGATGRLLLCSALKTHKKLLNEIVDLVLIRAKLKGAIDTEIKVKSNSGNKSSTSTECDNLKVRSKSDSVNLVAKNGHKNALENKQKYSGRLSVRDRAESKGNRSAPPFVADESPHGKTTPRSREGDWIVRGISKKVVDESVFCHCLSIVVHLIQYRSGRSLFPVEVASRTRRITVPDFTSTVLDYINEVVFLSERGTLTNEYKEHMLKLVEILKSSRSKMS